MLGQIHPKAELSTALSLHLGSKAVGLSPWTHDFPIYERGLLEYSQCFPWINKVYPSGLLQVVPKGGPAVLQITPQAESMIGQYSQEAYKHDADSDQTRQRASRVENMHASILAQLL